MQTTPDIADILAAVVQRLEQEVVPALPRSAILQAKLAINAIRLVERQLRLLPAAEAAEQARLEALLIASGGVPEGDRNAALAARIAAGAFDGDPAALLDHLWATSLDQLAIDQPGYAIDGETA